MSSEKKKGQEKSGTEKEERVSGVSFGKISDLRRLLRRDNYSAMHRTLLMTLPYNSSYVSNFKDGVSDFRYELESINYQWARNLNYSEY